MRAKFRWFNIGSPVVRIKGRNVRLWNLFNRHTSEGDHWWGVGIIQIGNRHLAFVGYCGIRFLFVGETP